MIKKKTLIVAPFGLTAVTELEKLLLSVGFNTLRIGSINEVFQRVKTDIFSIIICVDSTNDASLQKQLATILAKSPFGAITPVVGLASKTVTENQTHSLLDQFFPIDTDPKLIAEFCDETHSLRQQKAKKGQIQFVSVPAILHCAAQVKFDGAMVVEHQDEKSIIYMEKGDVVFASSNRDHNRFGEFLVNQGMITKVEFQRVTEKLKKSGKRFGSILVEEGIIRSHVLQALVQSQVKHIVYTVFDWAQGEYYILFDQHPDKNDIVSKFEVSGLILEGVRYKFDEERLNHEFSPYNYRVSLTQPFIELQKHVRLGKKEEKFLELIGSGRAMTDLLHLEIFNRLEVLKLLYAFRILELLDFQRQSLLNPILDSMISERMTTVDELFSLEVNKKEESVVTCKEKQIVKTSSSKDVFSHSAHRHIHLVLGALIPTIFILIVTFVDPRSSRESQSMHRPLTRTENVPLQNTPSLEKNVQLEKQPSISKDSLVLALENPKVVTAVSQDKFALLIRLASQSRKQGSLVEALDLYKQALALKPIHVKTMLISADLLFDLNRIEEAQSMFQQVIKIEPNNAQAYLALGTIYLMEAEPDRAIFSLRKYLAVVQNTPQTRSHIVEAKKILQRLESQE